MMLEQARAKRRALGMLNADTPPKPRNRRVPAGTDVVKLHAAADPAQRAA